MEKITWENQRKKFSSFYIGKPMEKVLFRKTNGKSVAKFSRNVSIKVGRGNGGVNLIALVHLFSISLAQT